MRGTAEGVVELPDLRRRNQTLVERNRALAHENARLRELAAEYKAQAGIAPIVQAAPASVQARVIGFPPEYAVQSVTIDKGTRAGVKREDGVVSADGVVGRIVEAGPFTSKVALLTDFTSTVPAVVAETRSWGVARGNESSVRLEYVSQDAALRAGQTVVTAEGRSFHEGEVLGTIVAIDRSASTLYQTAVVKPAVDFSTLDRVAVVPK